MLWRLYNLLLTCALLGHLPALAASDVIESSDTFDDIELATPAAVVEPVPENNSFEDNQIAVNAPALGVLAPLAGESSFVVGALRPIYANALGVNVGLLRAGLGIGSSLTLAAHKNIDLAFGAESVFGWDLGWRVFATSNASFSIGTSSSFGASGENPYHAHAKPSELSASLQLRTANGGVLHVEALYGDSKEQSPYGADTERNIGRLATLLDIPVAKGHTVTLSLALQKMKETDYYSYRSSTYYSNSRYEVERLGIPVGLGYRLELEKVFLSAGVEAGPTVTKYDSSSFGTYSYQFQGDSTSVLGMFNVAANAGVKF